jgi:isoamylase
MHVDGFRFDLAASLGRASSDFDPHSAFLEAVGQDPVLGRVKLIAEPWDIGWGGYDLGQFPAGWSEWNGRYRDSIRDFWRGTEGTLPDFATRIAGSRDLFGHGGRRPTASVNIVTVHDGFTLADLVSYNHKHNEANGEDNRDGASHNNSWNCGAEGPTDDSEIQALRSRQMRNFMATLLLSQGVPMLLAGDERARTQKGNNNAYCQDNEVSWLDWSLDDTSREMLEFTRKLLAIRREHPVLQRRRFFLGRRVHGADVRDIVWLRPDGGEMSDHEWSAGYVHSLGMVLNGQSMSEWSEKGELVHDDVLIVLLNAHTAPIEYVVPAIGDNTNWEVLVDTSSSGEPTLQSLAGGERYPLKGRSLALLIGR